MPAALPRLAARHVRLPGWLAVGLALCWAGRTAAQADAQVTRLIVSSGVAGRLAHPVCAGGETLRPSDFARSAAALTWQPALRERPLAFDTGGLLAARGPTNYALREQPKQLANLVAELGYAALVLGVDDLGARRTDLAAVVQALRDLAIPVIASNLRCGARAKEFCAALVSVDDPVWLHDDGKAKVALIGVMPRQAFLGLSPARARNFSLADPLDTMLAKTREARERGAELVIVSLDAWRDPDAAASALSLVRGMPEEERPDVMVVSTLGAELLSARPASVRPVIVAGPPGGLLEVHLSPASMGAGHALDARPLHASSSAPPPLLDWMAEIGPEYCRRWAMPLPSRRRVARPRSRQQLLNLAANVMLTTSGAEIAVVDGALVDQPWSPLQPRGVSRSDIEMAIARDEPLVVAEVDRRWLKKVYRELRRRRKAAGPDSSSLLRLHGVHREGRKLHVGWRRASSRARYRIVATRHAAQTRLRKGPRWRPVAEPRLRSAILRYLSHADDPRAPELASPDHYVEWRARVDSEVQSAGTAIRNPRSYDSAQLDRKQSATLGGRASMLLEGNHADWVLRFRTTARYQSTRVFGDEARISEGDDLITSELSARWSRLRARYASRKVPDLYAASYLESEFTLPEDRSYRHMLFRPTVGLSFMALYELELRVQSGFEMQLKDPEGRARPGAGVELLLDDWEIIDRDDDLVELDAQLNYFVTGLGGSALQTLRASFKTRIELERRFDLRFQVNLYGEHRQGEPLAVAVNVSVGLGLTWYTRSTGG